VHEIRRLQQEGFDTALEPGFDFETSFDDLDAEGAAEVAALEAELKRELSPAFNLLVTSFFANDDEGDAPAPSGDSGGTGSDGGGNADSGNGAVSSAIPAALIHPDGPGGWTSTPTPEGTLFKAGFSLDPNSDIEEVLDFYVDAFASLGAPTVTSRLVTPISGEVEASGPGGRGSVQIFAAPGIIGLQAEFLQFE
ncbi:MAG: hypothetical protein O6913_07750, partial [Chloroflexi bacterium]|nr:hypothetical protein [Chloroflexota bacterium]